MIKQDFLSNQLLGIARVITDFATTYYLADVVVDEQYRGNGIGKSLVEAVVSDERIASFRGILLTKDAHGLYEQFGFVRESERAMKK